MENISRYKLNDFGNTFVIFISMLVLSIMSIQVENPVREPIDIGATRLAVVLSNFQSATAQFAKWYTAVNIMFSVKAVMRKIVFYLMTNICAIQIPVAVIVSSNFSS